LCEDVVAVCVRVCVGELRPTNSACGAKHRHTVIVVAYRNSRGTLPKSGVSRLYFCLTGTQGWGGGEGAREQGLG
jgi:hypothetical protein